MAVETGEEYTLVMVTITDIEQAVERLSPEELRVFRAWFTEHDAAVWDRQFEEDVKAGRLEVLGDEASRERHVAENHGGEGYAEF